MFLEGGDWRGAGPHLPAAAEPQSEAMKGLVIPEEDTYSCSKITD